MTRTEFIKMCGLLGVSFSLPSFLAACKKNEPIEPNSTSTGKVLIIGAGAAGLSCAYLLKQKGIDFQIIEASTTLGGRLRVSNSFTDFPIPLGAEWLHVGTNVFNNMVNNNAISVKVNTVGYNSNDSYGLYKNNTLTLDTLGEYSDRKFVNGSWLGFYEEYIVPSISDKIIYNTEIKSIHYSASEVIATTTENKHYTGEKIIITVPLKILQNGSIDFHPPLTAKKSKAIHTANVWDGMKVFFQFSKKFYPTITDVSLNPGDDGEITIYDAAYGQHTNNHILGFLAVGSSAQHYISRSGNDLRDYILNKLDAIFSGEASPNYIQHLVHNWSSEPFIHGAYLNDHENEDTVATLFEPISNKVYFAGEAYTSGKDWGGVHAAAQAAKEVVDQITR